MNSNSVEYNQAFDEMANFFVEAFIEYHEKLWEEERLAKREKGGEANVPVINEHVMKLL